MRIQLLKRFDRYIIKKFLGTFIYSIILILSISIIFDLTEKIDEFIQNQAPLKAIIFDYYLNFIPYFANLYSGLFLFISVIFFTSKMAFNTEIIALLSSGISFRRLMVPYLVSALVVFVTMYSLGNFVIPPANKKMIDFQLTYVKKKSANRDRDIHRQIQPDIYIYIERYDQTTDVGRKFSIERYENNKLVSKLTSDFIRWDRERKVWNITNYMIRDIKNDDEFIKTGSSKDTTLAMLPEEFKSKKEDVEIMNYFELKNFIAQQKLRGVSSLEQYEVERHRRASVPFSVFILTIIGASLASRKVRGGIGLHIGSGIALSFTFLMFLQVSKVFAMSGSVSPLVAMWIPNILFAIIAFFIYRWAAR
jgi:lipopolysaccharide export system permease protein